MKIISVIVPLYNGGKYLRNAIHSIEEKNKGLSVEVLIVNDGSTDDSLSVAQLLSKEYSNIVVLSKENGGIASAREFGLNNCSGKYVTFLDQDDVVLEGYSSFIDKMEEYFADMLIANHSVSTKGIIECKQSFIEERSYNHEECVDLAKMLFCPEVFTPSDASERCLRVLPGTVWNCIFKLDFIKNNNLHFVSNVDYEDDWLFIGQTLGACRHLLIVPGSYYCWTVNPNSESHTPKYISNYFQRRELHKKFLLNVVSNLGATNQMIARFKHILDAQTVIEGGKNAMLLSYSNYLQEIKELSAFMPIRQFSDFKVGRTSSVFIWLWSKHLNGIAYVLNIFFNILQRV